MNDDAQNELRRRARRRLVGAIALALAAVIVLPMVMDHDPRMPAQDIQVRIPGKEGEKSIASRILPGKGPTPLPPVADSKAAAEPAPTVAEPVAPATPEAKPDPGIVARPGARPEPKPADLAAKPDGKPAEPHVAEKKNNEANGARAAAALSGQSGGGAEQWVVQLGAYKEAGNVKLLVKKLKELGVPSYTEQFDSPQGPRTRVRAGPFATKDAAEKAQAKAKIVGVGGPVAPK